MLILSMTICLLTSCAARDSNFCPAPAIASWDKEWSNKLADEYEVYCPNALPAMCRAVKEYYVIREQIRSCLESN